MTDEPARLHRLRAQLAAEHAKAVGADQHPRPDLDHLRVTAPNGIAAGLEIALHFADHHLREAETAVSAPAGLREQLRASLARFIDPDDDCMPALSGDGVGFTWTPADSVLDDLVHAISAIRDAEGDRLRADLATEQQLYERRTRQVERLCRERREVEAVVARVRDAAALHRQQLLTTAELYAVIEAAPDQPAPTHDGGPTVAEAAEQDARWWDVEKAGE